jgi:hypothetical protein
MEESLYKLEEYLTRRDAQFAPQPGTYPAGPHFFSLAEGIA